MSESGASFPGFGSEEVRNFPATETVTGSGEIPRTTVTQANTDHEEVSIRQGSPAVPPWGDSLPDHGTHSLRAVRGLGLSQPSLGKVGQLILPLFAGELSLVAVTFI